jgi:hypothetical protein
MGMGKRRDAALDNPRIVNNLNFFNLGNDRRDHGILGQHVMSSSLGSIAGNEGGPRSP